ncbi:putative trans-sialidase, partial [Trypanosoma cruzi]
ALATPAASTEIDGTGKALTECQDTSCLSTSFAAKQPEVFTTTSFTKNEKEQRPPPTATAPPRSPTPPPLFCFFLLRVRLLLRCPDLHEVVCSEYERRPKATELFL